MCIRRRCEAFRLTFICRMLVAFIIVAFLAPTALCAVTFKYKLSYSVDPYLFAYFTGARSDSDATDGPITMSSADGSKSFFLHVHSNDPNLVASLSVDFSTFNHSDGTSSGLDYSVVVQNYKKPGPDSAESEGPKFERESAVEHSINLKPESGYYDSYYDIQNGRLTDHYLFEITISPDNGKMAEFQAGDLLSMTVTVKGDAT